MSRVAQTTPAERLQATFEMWADGVQIMREKLRRRSPHASEQQIEDELDAWLADRPYDADGIVGPVAGALLAGAPVAEAPVAEASVEEAPLTPLAATMQAVIAAFPVPSFALVGGLAISARTEPWFMRVLEFAIAVDSEEEAQQIVHGMQRSGYLVEAVTEAIIEHRITKRMATARLRRDDAAPAVDLLFAASGIEPEITSAATPMLVLGNMVRVAQVGHLIALRLVARDDERHLQARVDLAALAQVADDAEWARAEAAVRLIAERGFDRGRDLAGALAE